MKFVFKNKGIILFYLALVICSQLYVWRIDRLEEKTNDYINVVTLNVK